MAVAEGDSVRAGDTLLDVTTDKVDVEVPSPASGPRWSASSPSRVTRSRSAPSWRS